MIVVDVWIGEMHQNLAARFCVETIEEAFDITKEELKIGNLINLRTDVAWGTEQNFDTRSGVKAQ